MDGCSGWDSYRGRWGAFVTTSFGSTTAAGECRPIKGIKYTKGRGLMEKHDFEATCDQCQNFCKVCGRYRLDDIHSTEDELWQNRWEDNQVPAGIGGKK